MAKARFEQRILVVDDALETLELLQRNLSLRGYRVFTAPSVETALEILDANQIDLVITDYKMPRVDGLDLVRHVRDNVRDAEVMMITGYASIGGAVNALRHGAEDYLAKPFTDEELFSAVDRALAKLSARRMAEPRSQKKIPERYGILGESPAMQKVITAIEKAATTPATVLITGESGTGKELVARATHYNSGRASAPFVPVNCGGIPEGLLESELFGHVKGSFTGASETRAGFFQTADRGTIFLDEISETSLAMQVKLLRVLQNKEVNMVGDRRTRKVDVRILAATNKDLQDLVHKELFRQDLFFRLSVITIMVPPLKDRGDDVLLLVNHFTEKFARENDKEGVHFSDEALNLLREYDWPGNVRELENVIQRLVIMTDGDTIEAPDLPTLMRFSPHRHKGLNRSLHEVEKEHIQNVLASVNGNKTRAAEILGIDRKTLREKLKTEKQS
ncbi:MAG: sigma-54 dependent transcriptional regulator [bacterium]